MAVVEFSACVAQGVFTLIVFSANRIALSISKRGSCQPELQLHSAWLSFTLVRDLWSFKQSSFMQCLPQRFVSSLL